MSQRESKRIRVGLRGAAAAKQLGSPDTDAIARSILEELLKTYTTRQIKRALSVIGRKP